MIQTNFQNRFESGPQKNIMKLMRLIHERFDATMVGIPPMENIYIGGASVKLFLPIFKMNFPEICGHGAAGRRRFPQPGLREHEEGYPMQAYKIMHGLCGLARGCSPNTSWWWTTT
jgi:4-hydroxy-3-polyprenylbenzoate decarboxylase